MSPPIPEPDVTPPLFDSFSSTPSVPELPSQEASLEDSTVEQDLPSEQPIETTYHLVLKGTIRGNTKLVTNTGYTFNIRKRRPNGTIDWQCTVRRKDHRCKASVIQRDGAFFAGMHGHNHPGEFGVLASTQIQSRVKQVQLIYFFKLFLKFVQINYGMGFSSIYEPPIRRNFLFHTLLCNYLR